MKKSLFPLLCTFVIVMTLKAENRLLTIYLNNDSTVKIALCEHPIITLQNDSLTVKTQQLEVTYPLWNIRKYEIEKYYDDVSFKNVTIDNDNMTDFSNCNDISNCNITYLRTFLDLEWQPLYVPFEIPISDYADEFDFAIINNFHQYDDDNNGIFDRTVLEIRKANSGETLLPNYPYLIKAKSVGKKTIHIENSILYSTGIFSIDCSSVNTTYVFTGTYNQIENIRSLGYYVLCEGVLQRSMNANTVLSPFSWYMQMCTRPGSFKEEPIFPSQAPIRIREYSSEDTGINSLGQSNTVNKEYSYSINGTKVCNPVETGIYIMRLNDGSSRKVIVK